MGERAEEMIRVALDAFANRDLARGGVARRPRRADRPREPARRRAGARARRRPGAAGVGAADGARLALPRADRRPRRRHRRADRVPRDRRVPRVHRRLASRAAAPEHAFEGPRAHRVAADACARRLRRLRRGENGSLVGAGSTLVAPLVAQWANAFTGRDDHLRRDRPRGAGIAQITARRSTSARATRRSRRPRPRRARIASSCRGRWRRRSSPTTSTARRRS